MAVNELKQEMQDGGAIKPVDASLTVTVSAETSASPEQVLAAARDFSEHRAQIWPNVEPKRLEVHERGDTWGGGDRRHDGRWRLLGTMPLRLVRANAAHRYRDRIKRLQARRQLAASSHST